MDDRRFDALTRALAHGSSRRTALKGLFGGVIGGVALTTRLDRAGAGVEMPCDPPCAGICCNGVARHSAAPPRTATRSAKMNAASPSATRPVIALRSPNVSRNQRCCNLGTPEHYCATCCSDDQCPGCEVCNAGGTCEEPECCGDSDCARLRRMRRGRMRHPVHRGASIAAPSPTIAGRRANAAPTTNAHAAAHASTEAAIPSPRARRVRNAVATNACHWVNARTFASPKAARVRVSCSNAAWACSAASSMAAAPVRHAAPTPTARANARSASKASASARAARARNAATTSASRSEPAAANPVRPAPSPAVPAPRATAATTCFAARVAKAAIAPNAATTTTAVAAIARWVSARRMPPE